MFGVGGRVVGGGVGVTIAQVFVGYRLSLVVVTWTNPDFRGSGSSISMRIIESPSFKAAQLSLMPRINLAVI